MVPTFKTKRDILSFINTNKLSEGFFFDTKNFSYFIKKYNLNFYFLDYKKIFYNLIKILYILKQADSNRNRILFVGLNLKDSRFASLFNYSLKKLATKKGHLYSDNVRNGLIYDHFSFFKRKTFLGDTGKHLPSLLFVFSRNFNEDLFKEFSHAGIPSIFLISDGLHSSYIFKDYPLFGIYSKKMLSFYLDFLNYSLTSSKQYG